MSLQNKTNEFVNAADDLMAGVIRENADTFWRGLANMDSEDVMMSVGMMKIYVAAKDLAEEQAKVMDSMKETIEILTKNNMDLRKRIEDQNYETQRKLDRLIEKVTKETKVQKN